MLYLNLLEESPTKMKFHSIYLLVFALVTILQSGISTGIPGAVESSIHFERTYCERPTPTTSNLFDISHRNHHTMISQKAALIIHRQYRHIRKAKGLFLPPLTLRGGSSDAHAPTIVMSTSSSSESPSAPIFDMDRMKIRLEGLSQYAVISALLLNVCLNIYFNTMKHLESDGTIAPNEVQTSKSPSLIRYLSQFHDRGMKITKVAFILSSIFSILSSAYTTVVFTLLGIYSKAALGMGCDTNFLLFFDTTQKLRESAFDAFVISLMSFEISFLSSLIIAYKGQYRLLIIAVTALCLSYSIYSWVSIMAIAGRLLYSTSLPTSR